MQATAQRWAWRHLRQHSTEGAGEALQGPLLVRQLLPTAKGLHGSGGSPKSLTELRHVALLACSRAANGYLE